MHDFNILVALIEALILGVLQYQKSY